MVAYAIEAATASGLFEHVIVSTEDDEIAAIAERWGGEVPFRRPQELAGDCASTAAPVAHAILVCEKYGWVIDKVCCISPCVPTIQHQDLEAALHLLEGSDANFSFPVTEFPSAIQRALRCDKDGKMTPIHPENERLRTQDLEPAFYDVGQFYWGNRDTWLRNTCLHSNGIGLPIPNWRVVDIDTLEDWKRAERVWHIVQSQTKTTS